VGAVADGQVSADRDDEVTASRREEGASIRDHGGAVHAGEDLLQVAGGSGRRSRPTPGTPPRRTQVNTEIR